MGAFVVIDGIDGCGKSSQIQKLQEKYPKSITVRDPGTTALGEELRNLLLHRKDLKICQTSQVALFLAARAQVYDEVIKPALAEGMMVFSDRWHISTIAYQSTWGGTLNRKTITDLCHLAVPHPDITIILDIDPDVAEHRRQATRSTKDRFEQQPREFFEKLAAAYSASCSGNQIRVNVTDLSVGQVHEEILVLLNNYVFNKLAF